MIATIKAATRRLARLFADDPEPPIVPADAPAKAKVKAITCAVIDWPEPRGTVVSAIAIPLLNVVHVVFGDEGRSHEFDLEALPGRPIRTAAVAAVMNSEHAIYLDMIEEAEEQARMGKLIKGMMQKSGTDQGLF